MIHMRNVTDGKWLCALAAAAVCSAALADRGHDDRHYDHHYDHHYDRYRGHGDMHRFYVHDYPRWRGGQWYHGYHGGRVGWWWTVDNFWYSYPQPIYPYPDPYIPPMVEQQSAPPYRENEYQEKGDEQQEPPPAQNWYYCNSARNYYPYVSACPEGWQTVPATPPDAPDQ
jgi:hypothetical protein